MRVKNRKTMGFLAMTLVICLCCMGCGSAENAETIPLTAAAAPVVYEYDSLQNMFLAITPDTTMEELESWIQEYALCFTQKEYNTSGGKKSVDYKIAYTDGTAKQSHADPGAYLDISFGKDTGTVRHAQYVTSGAGGSALLYCYGTWYSFSDQNAEDYSGYYYISYSTKDKGINIKYTNGNDTDTNYILYPSAEDLIRHILDQKASS